MSLEKMYHASTKEWVNEHCCAHQIQPEYGDEQADAERDGSTRLARPNSQARTGTRGYYFPCSADHEQDWKPYPVDPYSAICDDHTYIHTAERK